MVVGFIVLLGIQVVRFTPEQLEVVDAACERAGLSRTGWFRSTLIRVARDELSQSEPSL